MTHEPDAMSPDDATLAALLHASLDGELDAAAAAALAARLDADPAARARLAAMQNLAQVARTHLPTAPVGFTDRVMAALGDASPAAVTGEPAFGSEPRRQRSPRAGWRRLLPLPAWPRPALAAAMVAVAALGVLALVIAGRVQHVPVPTPAAVGDVVVHRFEVVAPAAQKVCLVGDFNAWRVCEVPMVRDRKTGTWTAEVPLAHGRHQYMFVLDGGRWITDPKADARADDGFGNQNAVIFL